VFKTAWNVIRTARRFIFSSKRDIHVQAAKGNVENIVDLLDDDPELVNLVDKMDFGTPLHWAAVYGQLRACKLLITRGANLEIVDDCGQTPLWWAIRSGEFEVVRLLLARGADPNMKDQEGHVALQHAQKYGQKKIAALLRKHATNNSKGD
jgi:ankyrin repeat protein